ncbi:MAG: FAD-dependent oxidoreductase [Planctomycetota bacterium]
MNERDPRLDRLAPRLRERTRRVGGGEGGAGEFVLYWMRAALRGHENPALEVAADLAAAAGRPLLVYQGLDERYPHASDRHHVFVLEGAREVAAELGGRGIAHVFHLARPGHRAPRLRELAARAASVVTEDVPVAPLRGWTRSLAARSPAPVYAVDAACVLPMALGGGAPARAFAFREATAAARNARVPADWPEITGPGDPPPRLPFAPIDLATADLGELVAACGIDHSVPSVSHTPGGSGAGYARWAAFRDGGLRDYARRRGDPTRLEGTSRLSPYLHLGMVSPFRIAREARARGGEGAEKFLDELLLWRELAWTWCFHQDDPDAWTALPEWARATLDDHRDDPRPRLLDRETLERARTGDALWDLAQLSLLRQGELHNAVRMTWGKAFLGWSATPELALARAIDLNHRYALDGRDPASYGGLLWCSGLFDRPFAPEAPVRGALRPRETADHAARLDLAAYRRVVARDAGAPVRIAVIGAGIAGLAAARVLRDQGLDVVVLDKGRGPGGRTSSRRGESGAIDHGAQQFRVRDPRFARAVAAWRETGLVVPWDATVHRFPAGGVPSAVPMRGRFLPQPRMSALAAHLARDLVVRTGVRVEGIARAAGRWSLAAADGEDLGDFDRVLVTAPADQARALLAPVAPDLAGRLAAITYAPCLAVMSRLRRATDPEFAALLADSGPLRWAAREDLKPGRGGEPRWILHGGPDWSREAFKRPAEEIIATLEGELRERLGGATLEVESRDLHRWRFALVETPLGEEALFDSGLGLGYAGDGCLGPRLEAAWLSGVALAGRVLAARAAAGGPEEQGELF